MRRKQRLHKLFQCWQQNLPPLGNNEPVRQYNHVQLPFFRGDLATWKLARLFVSICGKRIFKRNSLYEAFISAQHTAIMKISF